MGLEAPALLSNQHLCPPTQGRDFLHLGVAGAGWDRAGLLGWELISLEGKYGLPLGWGTCAKGVLYLFL